MDNTELSLSQRFRALPPPTTTIHQSPITNLSDIANLSDVAKGGDWAKSEWGEGATSDHQSPPTSHPPNSPAQSRLRRESGQTIILFPFAILFVSVFFLIAVNTALLGRQRIQMQEAADSGAIAAARVQGLTLGFIAAMNDIIAMKLVDAVADLADAWEIIPLFNAVVDIADDFAIIGIQDDAATGSQYMVEAATVAVTIANGATIGFALPPATGSFEGFNMPANYSKYFMTSEPRIDVARGWYTFEIFDIRAPNTPLFPGSGFYLWEKPVVVAIKGFDVNFNYSWPMRQQMPVPIAFAPDLKAPSIVAMSASRIYWIPGLFLGIMDPLNIELNDNRFPGTGVVGYLSMMLPGPFWGTRLEEVGTTGWDQFAFGAILAFVNYAANAGMAEIWDQIEGWVKQGAKDVTTEVTDEEADAESGDPVLPFL